jgi:hypothetical protein
LRRLFIALAGLFVLLLSDGVIAAHALRAGEHSASHE